MDWRKGFEDDQAVITYDRSFPSSIYRIGYVRALLDVEEALENIYHTDPDALSGAILDLWDDIAEYIDHNYS